MSPERSSNTRRLHLLRHAKSSWSEKGLSDRERPLNERGRRAARQLAKHLRSAGIRPQAVLVSPAVRTQETFERIRKGMPDDYEHWTEERLYGAGVEELIGIVAELPSGLTEVMLIAHNPGIGAFAGELAGPGAAADQLRRKFPTGALATIEVDCEWSRLRPAAAKLRDFVRPKDLG